MLYQSTRYDTLHHHLIYLCIAYLFLLIYTLYFHAKNPPKITYILWIWLFCDALHVYQWIQFYIRADSINSSCALSR